MVVAFLIGRYTANLPRPRVLVFQHSTRWTCPACNRTFEAGTMPAFVEEGTKPGMEVCIDCSH
jgi:hypothetical protein